MTIDYRCPALGRCRAEVLHRDTYRRTGRGPGGFEMHYTSEQCSRVAGSSGYCYQHDPATLDRRIEQSMKRIGAARERQVVWNRFRALLTPWPENLP